MRDKNCQKFLSKIKINLHFLFVKILPYAFLFDRFIKLYKLMDTFGVLKY